VVVRTVAPAIDVTTGVGLVRMTIAPEATPRPPIGLAGGASVDVGERPAALVVPASALRGAAAGGSELVVCDQGHARVAAVEVGARRDGRAEITRGITAEERVAVDNPLRLSDGAAIVVEGP
jgi:multidrug efflux pump subunit AcrA (membrane-fusion protein)